MSIKPRVHFQGMDGTPSLVSAINRRFEKLQRFYEPIIACQVTVDAPHHHKHKGSVYKVIIKLSVPGETLVVSHGRSDNPAHEDCYVAIHDAFRSARRLLQDYARVQRHDVKIHSAEVRERRAIVEQDASAADSREAGAA
ncbi:MAG: HPF/RaiA family ribosome-associated protein [Woeseia sp.]